VKFLIALLFAGKLGKLLGTGGTMLLSVFAYAWIFGWAYAVGFVGLLFAHEMGHYLAARQSGLKVGAPCFIPFVGAWIQLKEQPMNAEVEAYVGIAGPILGSAAAFIVYLAAQSTGSQLLLAISYAGFILNLFNLIPLTPLDGGRIVSVISPRIWLLGIPLLIGLFIWKPSPLLILIAIFAIPHAWKTLRDPSATGAAYYQASQQVKISYTIQYLALVGLLAITAYQVHEMLPAAG